MNEIQTSENITTTPALAELSSRMGIKPSQAKSAIKKLLSPNATEEELLALCVVANQYKLNPFLKEIYAFSGQKGGIVPIVGIDGWLKLINTNPQFDGMDVDMTPDGEACTCRIYRKDASHPIAVTEYLSECKKNTDPWRQWPRRMLRHKAIIQCGRVAFGFGGIYDEDEGRDAAGFRNATPQPQPAEKKKAIVPMGLTPPPTRPDPEPPAAQQDVIDIPAEPAETPSPELYPELLTDEIPF